MVDQWHVETSSVVASTADAVWARVVSPAGINAELRPWMTMSVPRGAHGVTIDTVPVGEPLGRAWLKLFGVLPFDYDLLRVTEIEPGRRFREESTMLSMRRWVHERTVESTPDGGGTTVTDRVSFTPRRALVRSGPLLRVVLAALFRHRHRRLARHFAAG